MRYEQGGQVRDAPQIYQLIQTLQITKTKSGELPRDKRRNVELWIGAARGTPMAQINKKISCFRYLSIMEYPFRKALLSDVSAIWAILQDAIQRRKEDGSDQWQDGYPNPETIRQDIRKDVAYVMTHDEHVMGYCAVLISDEPAYDNIDGAWKTTGDFVVFHRVAIAKEYLGQGLSYRLLEHIEAYAKSQSIESVRADTNYDNYAMMQVFDRLGYAYCGDVRLRGSPRRAYEKVLK